MKEMKFSLSDGRNLGYAEYGNLSGKPLFLFHGQPGNRLFRHPDDKLTTSLNVRLITVDRPGYGLSDFQPGRKLSDWPNDICELADGLGIDRFSVLGFSAGGPYALVCAWQIPQRLTRVGIVDSAPPMSRAEINLSAPVALKINYWLVHYAPRFLNGAFQAFWSFSRRNPESFIKMALAQSSPADKAILSAPHFRKMLEAVWKENLRRECLGYVQDVEILMNEWGFQLSEVQKEIFLWQGDEDTNVPAFWARLIADELPQCSATYFPVEGHFAFFSHWQEILQRLTM